MTIINNIDGTYFEFNGIRYFKNFTSVVAGNKLRILNVYDSKIELLALTDFSQVTLDSVIHTSVANLQVALLPVIYTANMTIIEGVDAQEANELIEKGFNHVINFDWFVFAQVYRFNGSLTNNLVTDTITLDPSPITTDFKRFDVIVFNDNFTFSVIKGDEGLNPAIPKIDPRTQLQLTVILVEANTTEPGYVNKGLMYDEGVGLPTEFAVTKVGTEITINSTDKAVSGTKSIKVANPTVANVLFLDKNDTFNSLDVDTITFKIKNETAGSWRFNLYSYNSIGGFYQGNTEIRNGRYGYNSYNTTDWQTIIVPRSAILGSTAVYNTGFALTFRSATTTFYFDQFAISGNFTQPPITSGIDEAPIDGNYYVRRNTGWFSITTLMTAWNNASNWIITNGTTLITHLTRTDNPHSVTYSQVGAQAPLVSATNIKTINGATILGSGDLVIGAGVTLGETDTTAYRGDRGKTAYDHSQSAHAPSNAQKNSDITKAEIEAKLTGEITTHTHPAGVGVLATVLTGISFLTGTAVVATDTVIQAFGKLQKQISDLITTVNGKQATLVSATNIKTINGESVLGSGDLIVGGSSTLGIVTVATTTYTLLLADVGKKILFTSATAVTVTIPTNVVAAIPIGSKTLFQQVGNGVLSFVTTGLTVVTASPLYTVKGQTVEWIKDAINTWSIEGNNFSGELRFPTYPSTRDDGVNPTNKVLGTDASGNLKSYKQGVFPAPYIDIVVPDSTLPSTTGNFELYGSFFTPTMTVVFTGQTVNYITFHTTNWVTVNVTTGATEGLFSITLDNGLTKTFTNAYMVVLGTIFKPVAADWTAVNSPLDVATEGEFKTVVWGQLAGAKWIKPFNHLINFRIYFQIVASPLGTTRPYDADFLFFALRKVSNNVAEFIGKLSSTDFRMQSELTPSQYGVNYTSCNYVSTETFYLQWMNGVFSVYKNGTLAKTFTSDVFEEDTYLQLAVKYYDIKGIKYVELA